MDQNVAFAIEKLKVGEFTKPMPFATKDGKQAYRILYLKTRTLPHRGNLIDDYQRIQGMALVKKQQDAIQLWIKKKVVNTFVSISDDYKKCSYKNKWVN
jgi:peptidyl-prolyl cis-trans isomerase SurA